MVVGSGIGVGAFAPPLQAAANSTTSSEASRVFFIYLPQRERLGSSASCKPSPTNEKPSIVTATQSVGSRVKCGKTRIELLIAPPTILPQLAVGSVMPIPRKLSPASAKITCGTAKVNETSSGVMAFGKT